MKKFSLLICSILTLGFFTSCNKSPEQKVEYMVEKVESKLDLTEEQTKQLKAIATKGLEKYKAHKEYRQETFTKAKDLVLSESISETQVKDLMQKHKDRKEEILNELLPEILEFHQSLSPEQKQKVAKFMEKMNKKFKKRWN